MNKRICQEGHTENKESEEFVTIKIKLILELHAKWLRGEPNGKRANLSGANLSGANLSRADLSVADLSGANLSGADLSGADLSGANLSGANLSRADLSGADLSGANLSRADLSGADLSGADLDFASWPLWCGSVGVKVDFKIAAQLAAHFCAVDCNNPEYQKARASVLSFAEKSHRAFECKITTNKASNE